MKNRLDGVEWLAEERGKNSAPLAAVNFIVYVGLADLLGAVEDVSAGFAAGVLVEPLEDEFPSLAPEDFRA